MASGSCPRRCAIRLKPHEKSIFLLLFYRTHQAASYPTVSVNKNRPPKFQDRLGAGLLLEKQPCDKRMTEEIWGDGFYGGEGLIVGELRSVVIFDLSDERHFFIGKGSGGQGSSSPEKAP